MLLRQNIKRKRTTKILGQLGSVYFYENDQKWVR